MRLLRVLVIALAMGLLLLTCGGPLLPPAVISATGLTIPDLTTTATSGPTSTTGETVTTVSSTTSAPTTTSLPTTTTTMEPCRIRDPGPPPPSGGPVIALHLSRRGFTCAEHVTVSANNPRAIAVAGPLAIERGGPLLIASPDLGGQEVEVEVRRLRPRAITIVGDVALPDNALPPNVSRPALITATEPLKDVDRDSADVWVLAGTDIAMTSPVAVMAAALDTTVRFVADRDPRALGPGAAEDIRTAKRVRPFGTLTPTRQWQLAVVRRGLQIPGGGQLLVRGRRLVAAYGVPGSSSLGILGEAGPDETLGRIRELALGYDTDGRTLLPTFEMIATVASAGAGPDDDYSEEISPNRLRPWIEFAGANGVYVVLDLQPGRTDFLTQAKRYEEFLRLPYVGLALDPEWRLEDDEVHLRQIGSVGAVEINQVVDWLAKLTRDELLPQKLLLIHQFKLSMIENRQNIRTPPELAVIIQMDGQGPLPTKYATFDAIVAGSADAGWQWGWKNFFDEDRPMADAEQVLAREPAPVFVSFQ